MALRVQSLEFVGMSEFKDESQLDYLEAKITCGYRRYCSMRPSIFDFDEATICLTQRSPGIDSIY